MTINPALAALQFVAGSWELELSHASFLPDPEAKVHAPVTFEWIEQGAALVMRMGDATTPTATSLAPGRGLPMAARPGSTTSTSLTHAPSPP